MGDNTEIIRDLYIEDMEDYCNVTFDKGNLPAGIILALDKCMSYDPNKYGIASEKLSDLSKTYKTNEEVIKDIQSNINKYRRPHLAGDKGKRPYEGGR